MIDWTQLQKDVEASKKGPWVREPMWPDSPVAVSGFTLSHFSKGSGGAEAEANTSLMIQARKLAALALAGKELAYAIYNYEAAEYSWDDQGVDAVDAAEHIFEQWEQVKHALTAFRKTEGESNE